MKLIGVQVMRQLYRLATSEASYLGNHGWFQSAIAKRPQDAAGRPLPWLSYPFIDFIRPRLRDTMQVIEFGTGYSTLFWAPRVAAVHGYEHVPAWRDEVQKQLPANARISLVEWNPAAPEAYAQCADEYFGRADIVLVDGPERNATLVRAADLVSVAGVVVLDNASRPQYAPAAAELTERLGFRRLDFIGMCPGAARESTTALFYRPGNCLGV